MTVDPNLLGLPDSAEALSSFSEQLNYEVAAQKWEETRRRFADDPESLERGAKHTQRFMRQHRQAQKAIQLARHRARGDPDLLAQIEEGVKAGAQGALDAGVEGVVGAFETLDEYTHRPIRGLISTGLSLASPDIPDVISWDDHADYQAFTDFFRKHYPNAMEAADFAGYPLGALFGGIFGVIAGTGKVLQGEYDQALDAFTEQFDDATDKSGDFLLLMATDPLTYVSWGAASGAKQVGVQVMRAAGRSGIKGAARKSLVNEAKLLARGAKLDVGATEKIGREVFKPGVGEAMFERELLSLLKQRGVKEEAIEATMGKNMRFLGEKGLGVGLPFFDKLELITKPTIDRTSALSTMEDLFGYLKRKTGGVSPKPGEFGKHTAHGIKQKLTEIRATADKEITDELKLLQKELSEIEYIPRARQRELLLDRDPELQFLDVVNPHAPLAPGFKRIFVDEMSRPASMEDVLAKGLYVDEGFRWYRQPRTQWDSKKAVDIPGIGKMVEMKEAPYKHIFDIKPVKQPITNLSKADQAFVEVSERFFDRMGLKMRMSGVLGSGDYNWFTGRYVPRIPAKEEGLFGSILEKSYGPLQARKHIVHDVQDYAKNRLKQGEIGPRLRPATGSAELKTGRPLAEEMAAGKLRRMDLDEIITKWEPAVERRMQHAYFERWMADKFGEAVRRKGAVPVTNTLGEKAFVPYQIHNELNALAKGAFERAHTNWMDSVMKLFKENILMPMPRYHLVNMMGDSFLMWANGFKTGSPLKPASVLNQTRKIWSDGTDPSVVVLNQSGRKYTKGEIQDFLRNNGVGVGQSQLDLGPAIRKPKQFQAALKGGPSRIGQLVGRAQEMPLRTAGTVAMEVTSLGLKTFGKKHAERWDRIAKTAFFMDRMRKGDTMQEAIRRTYEVLFDYSDQDKLLRQLRRVFPFATWQYKALNAVPRTVVRNPVAATVPSKLRETFGAREGDLKDPAKEYQREAGFSIPLGGTQRAAVREGAKGFGAAKERFAEMMGWDAAEPKEIHEGYGMRLRLRDPISESIAPWYELVMNSNPDPVLNMVQPILRLVAEWAVNKDLFTKRNLQAPSGLKIFNPGNPLARELEPLLGLRGGQLQAKPGQMAPFDRYVPPFIASPLAQWLVNVAYKRRDGLQGDFIGIHKPRATDPTPQETLQLVNMILAQSIALTKPNDPLLETSYGPEARNVSNIRRTLQ